MYGSANHRVFTHDICNGPSAAYSLAGSIRLSSARCLPAVRCPSVVRPPSLSARCLSAIRTTVRPMYISLYNAASDPSIVSFMEILLRKQTLVDHVPQ